MTVYSLQHFCASILEGLETGEHPYWFNEKHGLCKNAENYDVHFRTHVRVILRSMFNGAVFPFNDTSLDYSYESQRNIVYKNRFRLAFLEDNS